MKVNELLVARVYPSASIVFELKGFPDLIFKADINRSANVALAKKIIAEQQLTYLILPEMEQVGNFLVEEKYPISSNVDLYIHYYEQFPSNPDLKEHFRKLFLDMTRFIIATKLDDVRWINFPLFDQDKNNIKMLLLDLGRMKPNEESYPGFLSLLWMAHPDFHEDMTETAAKQTGMRADHFINGLDAMRIDKKNNVLAYFQGNYKHVKQNDIIPPNFDYWFTTPIDKIAEGQKNALDRHEKAKKWVQDHPDDQVLDRIKCARQALPKQKLQQDFYADLPPLLDRMSQDITSKHKQRDTLYSFINNTSGCMLEFLYNQELIRLDLVRKISGSLDKGIRNMYTLYY